MKNYAILTCLILLIAIAPLIYAQNETTNESGIDEINVTSYCGDGIIQQELNEQCDNGEGNGIICSVNYGEECDYCNESCELNSIKGSFCGDGSIDVEEECDDGNTDNSDYCSNDCKKTYECTFNSDCNDNNPCTEDKCQEKKCQRQNIEGKRIGNEYCLSGNLEHQRDKGVSCNENYECLTNFCSSSFCMEPAKEPNFLEKIINWILKFLGLAK